jgi:hypothetical protein
VSGWAEVFARLHLRPAVEVGDDRLVRSDDERDRSQGLNGRLDRNPKGVRVEIGISRLMPQPVQVIEPLIDSRANFVVIPSHGSFQWMLVFR